MLTTFENFINEGSTTSNKTLVTWLNKIDRSSSKWFRIGSYVRLVDENKIYKITKVYHNISNKNFNTSFMYELNGADVWKYASELESVSDEELSGIKYNL